MQIERCSLQATLCIPKIASTIINWVLLLSLKHAVYTIRIAARINQSNEKMWKILQVRCHFRSSIGIIAVFNYYFSCFNENFPFIFWIQDLDTFSFFQNKFWQPEWSVCLSLVCSRISQTSDIHHFWINEWIHPQSIHPKYGQRLWTLHLVHHPLVSIGNRRMFILDHQ